MQFLVLGMQLISSFILVETLAFTQFKGTLFFPFKGFLTRSPNKITIEVYIFSNFLYNARVNLSPWCLDTLRGSGSFRLGRLPLERGRQVQTAGFDK